MFHAPYIFKGNWKGEEVLICKQIDDFQIASTKRDIIEDVIIHIGKIILFVGNNEIMTKFNGACYFQTKENIKMHCKSYISNILNNH